MFFRTHIKQIVAVVDEDVRPATAPNLGDQLVLKFGCIQLLDAMYQRLPDKLVHGPKAVINEAFCEPGVPSEKGNDLTQALVKKGLRAAACLTVALPANSPLVELRRQYHCAAYNALASLFKCTQNAEKMYSVFLFQSNPDKGERLFENLVDMERVYTFPVELDRPLRVLTQKIEQMHDVSFPAHLASRRRHLTTQLLAGSSLSQASFDADVAHA